MTSKNLIVGICGFKGCGKDTVGDILVRDFGCVKDSYAKPLKDSISVIFGWDREMLEGSTKESRAWREEVDHFWATRLDRPDFTPRLALQLGGTEAGRKVFGEDLWTGSLVKRVSKRYSDANQGTVITDVRFPNEIETVLNMGGIVIQVSRGPNPDYYEIAKRYNAQSRDYMNIALPEILDITKGGVHASEWAWIGHPGLTVKIDNNGTLEELEVSVKRAVASL